MNSQDKALPVLLGLGNPAERLPRSELIHRALHTALTLLDADAVSFLNTPSRKNNNRLVMHAGSSVPAVLPMPPEGSDALPLLADGIPLIVSDLSVETRITRDGCPGIECGPVMFTPLRRRTGEMGYIAIYRRRGRASFTINDTRQMLLVAAWLNSALEVLRLAAASDKGAVTDDLTGIYNRRFLKVALRREVRRASRFSQELSIVVIDVDRPQSSDAEAPAVQNDVFLRELATALTPGMRAFDVMARHGDESIMVVLPQTGRAGAAEAAERMRAAVERHAFSQAAGTSNTVSLGVACYAQDATELKDLVAAADRALQDAKQQGGNCVVTLEHRGSERSSSELPRLKEWKQAV